MTPAHEMDISWQALRRIAKDWAGDSAELAEAKPLAGGFVNTTLCLTMNDGLRAVLKIRPHRVTHAFVHEAHQLDLLRDRGLPTPEVYAGKVGSLDDPFSYILMEFKEGVDLVTAKAACNADEFDYLQSHLAELVRSMHSHTSPRYHRARADSNKPEPEKRFEKWVPFFHHVYDPIWAELEKLPVLPVRGRKIVHKIHQKLDRLIQNDDRPRLVHWDLWSTNILAQRNGDGRWHISAVLDPNCKFAHAEAELAYLELFKTITPAFLKSYQANHRLSPDYHRFRKPIYQLYSLLNHARIFGVEYQKPLMTAVERVAPLV